VGGQPEGNRGKNLQEKSQYQNSLNCIIIYSMENGIFNDEIDTRNKSDSLPGKRVDNNIW